MTDDEQRLKELRDLTWSDRMEGVGEYLVNRFEKRVATGPSLNLWGGRQKTV